MATTTRKGLNGLILILMKLGPKLLKIGAKALKAVVGLKSIGAVASVGFYTYLFTWQMAIALVVFLVIHEYGHLLAMKQCGLKTKGIYLIPGVGAVAVAGEHFGGARNEAYIAIMGPVVGFVAFILPTIGLYYATGDGLWAAIAALMTFVNLFNLFPVNPLDGGRITKALLYSYKQSWGFSVMLALFVLAAVASAYSGFWLLWLISIIGLWELITDYGLQDHMRNFMRTAYRVFGGYVLYVSLSVAGKVVVEIEWSFISMMIMAIGLIIMIMFVRDIMKTSERREHNIIWYPLLVIAEAWSGVKSVFQLTHEDLNSIENYPQMSRRQLVGYAVYYVLLVALHIGVIVYLANIPGSGLAMELLK